MTRASRTAFGFLIAVLALLGVACGRGSGSPARAPEAKHETVDLAKPGDANAVVEGGGTLPWVRPQTGGPSSDKVPVDASDPVWGSPTAPVTLVAFQDFQCPFCSRAHPTVEQLKQTYGPAKLRVVFKHNPLPFHQDAMPAALAAQSVYEIAGPEAFFAYANQLFREQRALTDANLIQWAADVGVDRGALLRMTGSREVRAKIEADQALATAIGLTGTPSFMINGARLVGAQDYSEFKRLVDQELAAAQGLRGQGVSDTQVYATRVAANYAPPAAPEADRGAPEAPDTTVWAVPIGKSPASGPVDALVTIVEFSDYQCPYCKRANATIEELVKKNPGKIRLVFKHEPLPFHQRAMPAAIFAMEARAQKGDKGFWEATHALFQKSPALEEEDLLDLATELKLNVARVKTALSKESYKRTIQDDIDLSDDLEARGTPTFFINGRKLGGAQPLEKFQALVDQELGSAQALVAKGTKSTQVYAETIKGGRSGSPLEVAQSVPSVGKANPSRGAAKAPVTIQIFSDFQCPFCKRVLPTLEQVEKQFPGKVRVVWRNLPLPFHKDARPAAMAAMEAFSQKGSAGFWKMHELIYAGQANGLSRTALEGYAQQMGLDLGKFRAALDGSTHDSEIKADEAAAKAAGISGTPGFVINGYHVSGAQPFAKFKKVVTRALEDARLGRKAAP